MVCIINKTLILRFLTYTEKKHPSTSILMCIEKGRFQVFSCSKKDEKKFLKYMS